MLGVASIGLTASQTLAKRRSIVHLTTRDAGRSARRPRPWALLRLLLGLVLGILSILPAVTPARAATLTVVNGNNDGSGSLRARIASAQAGDVIVFAPGVSTITLTDELLIDKNLTIVGPGPADLTIGGDPNAILLFRIFTVTGAALQLSGVTISGGNLDTFVPGLRGGGVYVESGSLNLSNLVVTGNKATAGGGVAAYASTLTIRNTLITANTAQSGGGLLVVDSPTSLVNVTSTANTIDDLGLGTEVLITADDGSFNTAITSSTITTSLASQQVVYLSQNGSQTPRVTFESSIVASPATSDPIHIVAGTVQSLGHNLIFPADADLPPGPGDIQGQDPLLGPLANNGGESMTRALLANSPAIDAGSGSAGTDQRGLPRSGAGSAFDIGAFEVQPPRVDLNGSTAGTDFSTSFTEGSTAVPIVSTSDLTVTDDDSSKLTSATVRIVNPFDGASETLGVNTAGTGIAASYDPATSTLTLTGNPTTNLRDLAEYRQVLRTVTYQNTSTSPNTGTREIRFTLNDGVVHGPVATSNVTVGAVNNPPVNGLPASASTDEDTALVFSSGNNTQVSIADPDVGAGSISVKLTVEHGTLKLNGISGLTFTAGEDSSPTMTVIGPVAAVNTALNGMTFTPTANYHGSGPNAGSLRVETNDQQTGVPGGAKTDDDTMPITITSVNDLPTISDISDQSTNKSTAVGPITFSVNDVETAAGSLMLTGSSNNQALVPDAKITFGVSGGSRTVTVEPAAGQSGVAIITVTVTDADGGSASDTFMVVVDSVNAQPTIAPVPNQTTAEDTPLGPLALAIADDETAAAALLLTATSSDPAVVPNGNIVFGGSGATRTVTITPSANATGPTTITLTVHDTNGGEASRAFQLTVTPVNDPPTIADIPDQGTREGVAAGAVSFAVNDIDTPPANLALTASSSNQVLVPNANITFGGTGTTRTVTVTPAAGQAGTAAITVTVSDGQGGQATDTFEVTVGSALAPNQTRLVAQTTLSPSQPTVVWLPGAPAEATILVPAAVQRPTLDLGALLVPCSGDTRSATLPTALHVQREGEGGTIIWRLPSPVTITGPCSWDGRLALPSLVSKTTTLPAGAPPRGQITAIVDIAMGDVPLTFSRAYKLDLPGKQQNQMTVVRGVASLAPAACVSNDQVGADQLAPEAVCSTSTGAGLETWGRQGGRLVASNPGCGPRPNVRSALEAGGGALTVTISAVRSDALPNNLLRSVTFGEATNAQIEVPVQAGVTAAQRGTGDFAVQFSPTIDLTFTVRRTVAGQPTTVPITVVDGCGEWQTFVGGGASAGF